MYVDGYQLLGFQSKNLAQNNSHIRKCHSLAPWIDTISTTNLELTRFPTLHSPATALPALENEEWGRDLCVGISNKRNEPRDKPVAFFIARVIDGASLI